jgi:CheY-like chemotaxis protein
MILHVVDPQEVPMNYRVLIADDDADLLALLTTSLSQSGATVVQATTGAELLEHVAEDLPFDLVITDISMPWMTGLHVASSMRTAGLDVPLIIMTGLTDTSLAERVRLLGKHTTLLRKPFGTAQLQRIVTAMLPQLGEEPEPPRSGAV